MIDTRRLVISALGAVLLAAPLICSQDAQRPEAKLMVTQPLALQVLELQPQRFADGWAPIMSVSAPAMSTPDLSRYRASHFGETLQAIAKQAGLDLSGVKLLHERPAVIQELEWPIWLGTGSSPQTDPVKTILFSFYDGELFRIVVNYDRDETQGLTTNDMIEAISAKYGKATHLGSTETAPSSSQVFNDGALLIGRWEDAQYSFNLYHSTNQATFELIAFSKKVNALAQVATVEADRLDALSAPQREINRQQMEDQKEREALEKARQVNKPNFRP
jgi:hypothetical protein